MTFQPGAVLNRAGFGGRHGNVEVPHYDSTAAASTTTLTFISGTGATTSKVDIAIVFWLMT